MRNPAGVAQGNNYVMFRSRVVEKQTKRRRRQEEAEEKEERMVGGRWWVVKVHVRVGLWVWFHARQEATGG
jgi:hypothetical protein